MLDRPLRSPSSSDAVTGTILHGYKTARDILDPLFATYYAIPVFAFYPLFIVMFGLGDGPQLLIGFLLGVVAVIVTMLNGLDRVPLVLKKTARINRLGPLQTALRVTLPFCAPYLLTAAKLALAYAFIGVIGSEFIMARSGMGYEIGYAYTNFDNATMYPLILLILLLSIVVNGLLSRWEKSAAVAAGAEIMHGEERKPLRNTVILIVGMLARLAACLSRRRRRRAALAVADDRLPRQADADRYVLDSPARHARSLRRRARHRGRARPADRLCARAARLSGDAMEPMLVALYSIPKITLYPIILLVLRPRPFRQDRLWRHPRHHPGRAVYAQRRAHDQADPDQDRPCA